MQEDFYIRLKHFRCLRGYSQSELAERIGISSKQVSDYEVNRSKPRDRTLVKILEALAVTSAEFFSAALDDSRGLALILKIPVRNWVDVCLVDPSYIESDTYVHVDSTLLKRESTEGLFAINMSGMSMYPFLGDGDLIIVDANLNTVKDGALHIMSIMDESSIKQCFKQPDGNVQLAVLNGDFPAFSADLNTIRVVGRPIFKMGLLD